MEKDLEMDKYFFNCDSLLNDSGVMLKFKNYLDKIDSDILFMFLLDIYNITEITKNLNDTDIIIIKKYLEIKKIAYLLSDDEKTKIQKFLSQKSYDINVDDFKKTFTPILNVVMDIIINDYVPKFIRDEDIQKFLIKNYKNNSGVLEIRETKNFNYTNDSFRKDYIYEEDFKFFEHIKNETFDWSIVINDKTHNSYISRTNYLPNVRCLDSLGQIKIDFVIEENNLLACVFLLFEVITNSKYVLHGETIKHFNSKDISDTETQDKVPKDVIMSEIVTINTFGPLFTDRIFSVIMTAKYEENHSFVLIIKPKIMNKDELNNIKKIMKEKHKYDKELVQAFTFQEISISNIGCGFFRFQLTWFHSLFGNLSSKFVEKMIARNLGKKYKKEFHRLIKKHKNKNYLTLENMEQKMMNDPIGKLIFDTIKK